MSRPLDMPEIRRIEGFNKTVVDETITWDGENDTQYIIVPLTRMLVPSFIAVKSTPAITLSLEHYFADEDAQSTVTIGDEEGGQVTITAADEGDLGYIVKVVLPEDPEGATDLDADLDDETGVLTITLAVDAEGDPDDTKNTASAIATKVATLEEFTTEKDTDGVIGEGEYEFTGGIVPWWADTTDPDGEAYALPISASGSGVFGPFPAWPRGLKGRIKVTATTPSDGDTTRILVQGV